MKNPGNIIALSSSSSSPTEVTEGGSFGSQSRSIATELPFDHLNTGGGPEIFAGDLHEYVRLLGRGYHLSDQTSYPALTGHDGASTLSRSGMFLILPKLR